MSDRFCVIIYHIGCSVFEVSFLFQMNVEFVCLSLTIITLVIFIIFFFGSFFVFIFWGVGLLLHCRLGD